jgi:hypothetical protein
MPAYYDDSFDHQDRPERRGFIRVAPDLWEAPEGGAILPWYRGERGCPPQAFGAGERIRLVRRGNARVMSSYERTVPYWERMRSHIPGEVDGPDVAASLPGGGTLRLRPDGAVIYTASDGRDEPSGDLDLRRLSPAQAADAFRALTAQALAEAGGAIIPTIRRTVCRINRGAA